MKIFRTILICSCAIIITSCTNVLPPLVSWVRFASPVKPSLKAETNTTVIYGKFSTGPDFAFGNELGLRLLNEASKKETIVRMREKDSVYAIEVQPGKYRVAGFVAAGFDRRTAGRRSFRNSRWFEVKSGFANYVGDFSGEVRIGVGSQTWRITGLTNNFSQTTSTFQQKYPNLNLPIVSVFDQESK